MRFFCAWLVLFGSKFVILEALVLAFGDFLRASLADYTRIIAEANIKAE